MAKKATMEHVFQGIGVSPGVARGKILVYMLAEEAIPEYDITPEQVAQEVSRFEQALFKTRQELHELQQRIATPATLAPPHTPPPPTPTPLTRHNVVGFATDVGSHTSHTAIVARSLNLPAVVGLHDVSQHVHNGQPAILDGYSGALVVEPSE